MPTTSRGLDESLASDGRLPADPDSLAGDILVHDDIGEHPERTNGWFGQPESFVSSWIRHAMRESNGRTGMKVLEWVRARSEVFSHETRRSCGLDPQRGTLGMAPGSQSIWSQPDCSRCADRERSARTTSSASRADPSSDELCDVVAAAPLERKSDQRRARHQVRCARLHRRFHRRQPGARRSLGGSVSQAVAILGDGSDAVRIDDVQGQYITNFKPASGAHTYTVKVFFDGFEQASKNFTTKKAVRRFITRALTG